MAGSPSKWDSGDEKRKNNHVPETRASLISIKRLYVLLLAAAPLLLPYSCTKDPIREEKKKPVDTTHVQTYKSGIFIINEGNFNWGNASVTYIDSTGNTVIQDIFSRANSRNLGDVAQSMTISGSLGYLVINNSNRIEVVNLDDFKVVKTITGLQSPRYLHVIDSGKAYATNLQNSITILDLATNSVKGTIKAGGWTENMIPYGNYVLVTSIGKFSEPSQLRKAQLFVIDTRTDAIIDSIESGKEPIGLVIDKKQKVWVLCSGGYDNYEPATLMRVNPELRIVEKTFTFPNPDNPPSRLCINPGGDTLYFLRGGVYQMPVTAADLPAEPLIPAAGRNLYGLSIHPVTGRIYVSDVKDYVRDGAAFQYTVTGEKVKEYPTGRIPGSFCFSQTAAR